MFYHVIYLVRLTRYLSLYRNSISSSGQLKLIRKIQNATATYESERVFDVACMTSEKMRFDKQKINKSFVGLTFMRLHKNIYWLPWISSNSCMHWHRCIVHTRNFCVSCFESGSFCLAFVFFPCGTGGISKGVILHRFSVWMRIKVVDDYESVGRHAPYTNIYCRQRQRNSLLRDLKRWKYARL